MGLWLLIGMLLSWNAAPLSADPAVTAPPAANTFVWPVSKQIAGQKVEMVSKFGRRQPPDIQGDELHEGIDFAVPPEAAVRAARSGKVIFAGYSNAYVSRKDKREKSRLVIIRHPDGMSTRYVHIERLQVKPGQDVFAGDILGAVAESDEWTGPVIHFEIRNAGGKALDPLPFLQEPAPGNL